MKNYFRPLFLFGLLTILLCNNCFSQEEKPKIALVLSGGGAKGIAHIPLLQTLDSLNIVPDIIIGTSMGSVTGGLYAMGYSGDSIAHISKNLKWSSIFNKPTSFKNTSVEEKSEYGKYLIDFEINKGIKPAPSLINDQVLREFIALMTFPVYNVNDFDKLAIPLRIVATDIVNRKEIVLKNGSVAQAIRASMSIPGIFEPVDYKNTLLIDGGLMNNFPTDIAKNLGATIIIGSDVSGGSKTKEQLNNFGAILGQAMTIKNGEKYEKNKSLCDILIDHVPNITYGTKDFAEHVTIYEQGKIAVTDQKKQLIELSEKLKKYKQADKKLPKIKNEIILDTIVYKNITPENIQLVKERANLRPQEKYKIQDVFEGVKRAMGTNLFNKITYEPLIEENKIGLKLTGYEKSKHQIKASIHYDDYRGIGLIGNYTARNLIGRASRLLVTLDIAEQPKSMLQYQQIFGKRKNWWWRYEQETQKLKQSIFLDGEIIDDINQIKTQSSIQLNRNLNPLKSYIGFAINYNYNDLSPRVAPDVNNNILSLKRYYSNFLDFDLHFNSNSLDDVFYPKSGNLFNVNISRSLINHINYTSSDIDIPHFIGKTNDFTKVTLYYKNRLALTKKITSIIDFSSGIIFEDNISSSELPLFSFGFTERFSLGGNKFYPDRNYFSFQGLYENEVLPSQFIMLQLGAQYELIKKIYITPNFNIATVGYSDFNNYINSAFSPKGKWENGEASSAILSFGANIGYNSLLGPINFGASWTNEINKVRYFFSVGIPLNR